MSAGVGSLSAWHGGYIASGELPTLFRTWMLADASGALLIAPLILVWGQPPWPSWPGTRRALQALVIMGLVAGLSVAVFSSHDPLTYVVYPSLILAAVALGQRGATVALIPAAVIPVQMTAGHAGPFVLQSIDEQVLNTQLYLLVATITTLTLGAAVSARRAAALELAESRRREAERAAEERQRIARDLHDSVSQTLFSLGLHAGIAKHEVARAALPEGSALPAAIYETAELAQGALLEMRASIFALRGGTVAEQGLVAALGAHATALSVRHDVRVAVAGPEDRLPLEPEVEELAFRIGQEAVTNAVKHSGSESVAVRVSVEGRRVVLLVEDEGTGFDPSHAYAGHMGLELIRARAEDAGGVATVVSAPGTGTTVRLVVPASANGRRRPDLRAPRAAPPASVS